MAEALFPLPDGTTGAEIQQDRCKGSPCFGLFAFVVPADLLGSSSGEILLNG